MQFSDRFNLNARSIFMTMLKVIYESLCLPFWLVFYPTAWKSRLQLLNKDFNAETHLGEIVLLKENRFQRNLFLFEAFFLMPLILSVVVGIGMLTTGRSFTLQTTVFVGAMSVAMVGGLVMARMVNLGSGILFAANLAFYVSMMSEKTTNIIFPYALSCGLAGSFLIHRLPRPEKMQFAGFRGYLAGVITAGVAIGVIYWVTSGKIIGLTVQPAAGIGAMDLRTILPIGLFLGLVAILFFYISLKIQSPRQPLVFLQSMVFGLLTVVIYVILLSSPLDSIGLFLVAGAGGGLLIAGLFGLVWNIVFKLGGPVAGGLLAALCAGLGWIPFANFVLVPGYQFSMIKTQLAGFLLLLYLSQSYWRPIVFFPIFSVWNDLLYQGDMQRMKNGQTSLIAYHAAFWDEYQKLPWPHLNQYLVMVAENDLQFGMSIFNRLMMGSQRWAVIEAILELAARRMERCQTLSDICASGHRFDNTTPLIYFGGIESLLRTFSSILIDIQSALNLSTSYHVRLALGRVYDRLESLENELMLGGDAYAARFLPSAVNWRRIVEQHLEEMTSIAKNEYELDNPFVFGIPLNEHQRTFVGRQDVFSRIEKLVMDYLSPPLLIYGQRRMGKTSLLLNLNRMLSHQVVPIYIDCEKLRGIQSYQDLIPAILHQMYRYLARRDDLELPVPQAATFSESPFLLWNEWLDKVETIFVKRGIKGLIVLDEFDVLDSIFSTITMEADQFLMALRYLVQHRAEFRLLISGVHRLDQIPAWVNLLVNAQMIEISYLTEQDARKLIEEPYPGFALRYEVGVSDAILLLTHRHPYLMQLVCYELVQYKNEGAIELRGKASMADLKIALDRAFKTGAFFFLNIQHHQISHDQLYGVQSLANLGPGARLSVEEWMRRCPDCHDAQKEIKRLMDLDLLDEQDDRYGFKVEMIRVWFEKHASLHM